MMIFNPRPSLHIMQFGTSGCRVLLSRSSISVVSYCALPNPSEDLTTKGPHNDVLSGSARARGEVPQDAQT
ncbi:hypothetical protein BDV36DRAFT_276231 [Aspergillus pseudocaelatus]|uniref:Uncharacterized protein n=1 Tax=Aspergillus pseudocaelatus TaxID=1825620 RepID=A0ABQ6W1F6_9EURO|nr:hypothetical protein BDV36DRAFT_276231 [Aspergillus pseudocaelatus]